VSPLDPERGYPTTAPRLPPFPAEPGTKRYIVFNNHIAPGQQPEALYLRVPLQFAGDDAGEPVRAWGLNLLVHYPDMTGARNPQNIGRLGVCAGGCPGEMMISVYNDIGSIAFGPELRLKNLERDMHNPALVHTKFSEVASDEFSNVIKEEHGMDPRNTSDEVYFVQRRPGGSVEFFADCRYNTPVHLCVGYAAASEASGIEVQYTFRIENIYDWKIIQTTVLRFAGYLIAGVFDYGSDQP
jgi:hypothetical protein